MRKLYLDQLRWTTVLLVLVYHVFYLFNDLGLFVVHWITGYLNIRLGGGLSYIPKALIYPISVISGTGPLWFIQMLFLFSCILVLLRKLDPADRM